VGFTIDTAAVPDCDALMECFREGFEEVLELAGDHHPVELPLTLDLSKDAFELVLRRRRSDGTTECP
jgi:hypothetical protein